MKSEFSIFTQGGPIFKKPCFCFLVLIILILHEHPVLTEPYLILEHGAFMIMNHDIVLYIRRKVLKYGLLNTD